MGGLIISPLYTEGLSIPLPPPLPIMPSGAILSVNKLQSGFIAHVAHIFNLEYIAIAVTVDIVMSAWSKQYLCKDHRLLMETFIRIIYAYYYKYYVIHFSNALPKISIVLNVNQ